MSTSPTKNNGGGLEHIYNYNVPSSPPPLTYLFIGEVDNISHFYGQESNEAKNVLKKIDNEIERIYTEFKRKNAEPVIVVWSDHGHMMIEKQIDIYEHFNQAGLNLFDLIHIIDTNFARFWFRNDVELELTKKILDTMPYGFILGRKELEKYHTVMPDRRYGDIIYYLDFPYMFKKTVWGYG